MSNCWGFGTPTTLLGFQFTLYSQLLEFSGCLR